MRVRKTTIIEGLIGLALLMLAAVLYWWSRQLVWIMIYPPPIEKQIMDISPYVVGILGVILIIDSLRRRF